MDDTKEYYIYKQSFSNSFRDRFNEFVILLKCKVRIILSNNKWTSKFLDSYEVYVLNKYTYEDKNLLKTLDAIENEYDTYKDIKLKTLVFYEAIEIDNFDNYKRKILSKFADNQFFYSTKSKDDLKQTLSEIKQNLDIISWGRLFYLSYKNKIKKTNDLISSINVSYIKTNESYFILKIEVTPSEKFHSIFNQIVSSEDFHIRIPHYNTILNILVHDKNINI